MAAGRIAACWYTSSSFNIDVNLTDGATHRIALYLLDWDLNNSRVVRIDVLDATNNTLALTVAQYLALGTVLLTQADVVTLTDTGANIASLTAGQFSALAGNGIDFIDATDNVLTLALAQAQALGTTLLTAADAVTVTPTSGQFNALVPGDFTTLGASLVERHITLDRAMWGTDQAASVEPRGLERLVQYIRDIEAAMGDGVKTVYESEYAVLQKLRRTDRSTLGAHAVN